MVQQPSPPQPGDRAASDTSPTDSGQSTVPDQPLPPPPPPPAPPQEPGQPPARKSRRGLLIVLGVVAGVVVLAVGGLVVAAVVFGEDVPEVGECLTQAADPADIDVVDCESDRAAWRVIGHHGTLTEEEFAQVSRADVCQAFPDWENALWLRTNLLGGDGQVVCLVPAGPQEAPAE